jgi:hypothetical protein
MLVEIASRLARTVSRTERDDWSQAFRRQQEDDDD